MAYKRGCGCSGGLGSGRSSGVEVGLAGCAAYATKRLATAPPPRRRPPSLHFHNQASAVAGKMSPAARSDCRRAAAPPGASRSRPGRWSAHAKSRPTSSVAAGSRGRLCGPVPRREHPGALNHKLLAPAAKSTAKPLATLRSRARFLVSNLRQSSVSVQNHSALAEFTVYA
jgi:hypothetical protein